MRAPFEGSNKKVLSGEDERCLVQTVSNAFCESPFGGNPAATIVLRDWLAVNLMQSIAEQNNLPETTFVLIGDTHCEIRWFTPTIEVTMAGHATLAAAHLIFQSAAYSSRQRILFRWRGGEFSVFRQRDILWMEFPLEPQTPFIPDEHETVRYLAAQGIEASWLSKDVNIVLRSTEHLEAFRPEVHDLVALPGRGLALSAASVGDVDYVSRFFCPRYGVTEDPVTGSSHAIISRYWAERLGKNVLKARQCSARGGWVYSNVHPDRTNIGGRVMVFSNATLQI